MIPVISGKSLAGKIARVEMAGISPWVQDLLEQVGMHGRRVG